MKPTLVHISSDYPDPLQPRKTKAVLNLVEGTPEFRHVVYSLNRYTAFGGIAALPFGEDRTALAYGALPKGLLWGERLHALAEWIIEDLIRKNIVPDIVEAHKFTIEGVIGLKVAQAFSCPLVCDIQGNTDGMVLNNKPGFRGIYRTIASRASLVFPYAPWAIAPFADKVSLPANKCQVLPVIPEIDTLSPAPVLGSSRLISIFNLDLWKIKNLDGLARAIAKLAEQFPNIHLDIYGQGDAENLVIAKKLIEKAGQQDRITLKGPVQNNVLPQIMKGYDAFVMPTLHETYGLVYVESLFAGLPVLYSKGRSIDGYFNPQDIGYACDPESVADIANGIAHLLTHETALKQNIAQMQQHGAFDHLRKRPILETYRQGIGWVLSKKSN
jgi:glycosyltransferase involved in cell wall biosynthesis